MAQLANLVTQRLTTPGVAAPTVLTPGKVLAPATLIGIDLSGAAANTTYKFTVTAPAVVGGLPTVTVSIPPSLTPGPPATITLGVDSAGNKLINVDTGTGRLTLSVPAASFTDVATALAGLDSQTVSTVSGPSTIGDEYAQQIAALGVESQTAVGQSANQAVLINQLTSQRLQTSGVSLDEETINLITYQKAYQAAARIVTVMDEMLDTLINSTGRVGR
jgi:flagellar hook-associated protein 1 FlgK